MFWLLVSETIDDDGDAELTVGSFKKTPEKLHKKGKNPISLFFRFFWGKIRKLLSISKGNKGQTIKEALVYPEDEVNSDNN